LRGDHDGGRSSLSQELFQRGRQRGGPEADGVRGRLDPGPLGARGLPGQHAGGCGLQAAYLHGAAEDRDE
ncbi:Hypothetical predicted protein, partial [Olea europaea subsp. europaea]